MKSYILGVLTALCAFSANAASEQQADTIIKVTDVRKVVITESANGVNYSVQGTEADSSMSVSYTQAYSPDSRVRSKQSREFHFMNSIKRVCSHHWEVFMGGLGLGMVSAPGAPASMELEMGKSFEINWLHALAVGYRAPWNARISLGMGFAWRNYRSTTASMRMVPENNVVGFKPWEEGATGRHTAIKTFSMQFPLLYTQYTRVKLPSGTLNAAAGAVLNVSTYASVKNGWNNTDGEKVNECFHGVGQRKVSVDLLGVISAGYLGAYVRYSPQSVLSGTNSPKFKSFSVGLMLMF